MKKLAKGFNQSIGLALLALALVPQTGRSNAISDRKSFESHNADIASFRKQLEHYERQLNRLRTRRDLEAVGSPRYVDFDKNILDLEKKYQAAETELRILRTADPYSVEQIQSRLRSKLTELKADLGTLLAE